MWTWENDQRKWANLGKERQRDGHWEKNTQISVYFWNISPTLRKGHLFLYLENGVEERKGTKRFLSTERQKERRKRRGGGRGPSLLLHPLGSTRQRQVSSEDGRMWGMKGYFRKSYSMCMLLELNLILETQISCKKLEYDPKIHFIKYIKLAFQK